MSAPLVEASIEKIRDLIVSGKLAPGERLPPENDLAGLLGSSRSTVREAVRALVMARVLDVRRGDGTYVTSLRPELLLQGFGFAVDLMSDENFLEIVELRRVLEPPAAGIAAMRINSEQVAALNQALDDMRAAVGDENALAVCDERFHHIVADATGNQSLATLLKGLLGRTVRARIWRGLSEPGVSSVTVAQHEQIADAIGRRDGALAEAAALIHVATTESWLRKVVGQEAVAT